MTDKNWTIEDDCKALLEAIDHTLSVHGHIDANTPLHERIERTLTLLIKRARRAA